MDLDKYFVKSELIPAVIQEHGTNEVLMLAYMNKESLAKTLETGYTWFSRVQGKSCGTRAKPRVIRKRLSR